MPRYHLCFCAAKEAISLATPPIGMHVVASIGAIVMTWHQRDFYVEARVSVLQDEAQREWMASKGEVTKFWRQT